MPDHSDEVDDVNDIFPKLSYYLQLTSNSALKGSNAAVVVAKSKASSGGANAASDNEIPQILNIKSSPPSSPVRENENAVVSNGTAVTCGTTTAIKQMIFATSLNANLSTTTMSTTTAGNKISLVPTNILMKPPGAISATQPTATNFRFNPQQFLCTKPGGGAAGGGPMKVLLVNTLQKPQVTTSSSTTVTAVTTLPSRSLVNIQPKMQVSSAITSSSAPYQTRSATASANATCSNVTRLTQKKYLYTTAATTGDATTTTSATPNEKRSAASWKKNAPGFRTLLQQLVQLQNKTLDISRQRLDVEKERMSFERDTGEKILNVLSSLLQQRKDDTETPEQ